jgi:hydroxyacylglutathione hydrolase
MSAWTDLGGGVQVRQSLAYQMNSTLLLDPAHTVLVDPGILPSELDDLAQRVRQVNPAAITLVLTHAHWDHVLGPPWWPSAAIVAHDHFAAGLKSDLDHIREEADKFVAEHGERWARRFEPFRPREAASGLHFTQWGRWRAVLRDAFGHCDSQLSVHLPEQRTLIAADMLSDIEIPLLRAAPDVYRATLETLWPVAEGGAIETLIPGHGAIARGRAEVIARFKRDLAYLEALEREVKPRQAAGAALADIQKALAGTPDVERHPDYPMRQAHERNVELTFAGGRPAR